MGIIQYVHLAASIGFPATYLPCGSFSPPACPPKLLAKVEVSMKEEALISEKGTLKPEAGKNIRANILCLFNSIIKFSCSRKVLNRVDAAYW